MGGRRKRDKQVRRVGRKVKAAEEKRVEELQRKLAEEERKLAEKERLLAEHELKIKQAEQNMTDEELLADYKRRRNLLDSFLSSIENIKKILLQRRKELEERVDYFLNTLTAQDRINPDHLNKLFYEQGFFDGRLHQMKINVFRILRRLKPQLIQAGIDKAERIDGEFARIDQTFSRLRDSSYQFSMVLAFHQK